MARIESSYRRLAKCYEISLLEYVRNQEAWQSKVEAVLHNSQPNGYYDWFLGHDIGGSSIGIRLPYVLNEDYGEHRLNPGRSKGSI